MSSVPTPDNTWHGIFRDKLAHLLASASLYCFATKKYRDTFKMVLTYGLRSASQHNRSWKPAPNFVHFSIADKRNLFAENSVIWIMSTVATQYYGMMIIGSLAYGMSALAEDSIDDLEELL